MIVTCNECSKEFEVECKTKIVDDIEVTYFKCIECNQIYVISCVNDYIKKEQRRFKRLTNKTLLKICHKNIRLNSNRLKSKLEKSDAFKDL